MIRKITPSDKADFLEMTREFYASDAVLHPIPESYHETAWRELMRSPELAECYFVECDGQIAGYMLLSYMFSHECGGMAMWLEELYIRPAFQRRGIGHACFSYIKEHIEPHVQRIRLEIEPDNDGALRLYKAMGYEPLSYAQMVKDIENPGKNI